MTRRGPGSFIRRLGLRSKLMLASLVLIMAPLVVIWSIGLFEWVNRQGTAAGVDQAIARFSRLSSTRTAALERRGSPAAWLRRFAEEEHLLVRVLDRRGSVLQRTSYRHAERWSHIQRGWYRRAGDFFFGPAGPPDARAYEASLPTVALRPEVRRALAGQPGELWRYARDSRLSVYYRAQPLPGGGAVYLTRYSRRSIRALYDLRYQVLKLTLALAAVALVAGLWIGWRIVTPLVRIQRAMRDYLSRPRGAAPLNLPLTRGDEIGELSRDVQELTQRLDQRLERTARVAADLAHDLKNPIATITTAAELLQGDGELDPQRRRRIARATRDAAQHMDRSVEGMLELARLDERLSAAEREPLELGSLLQATVAQLRRDPRADGITVELALPDHDVALLGVERQLQRLLRNLLDNALCFCREQVLVKLQVEQGWAGLMVCDDGPGVSAGNRSQVFNRFFTARPEDSPPGTGLGLAISRAIARAHGGDVSLAPEGPLPGACFRVRLPCHSS